MSAEARPSGDAFDAIDRNHDGVISREEFAQAGQVLNRPVVAAGTMPAAYTVSAAPRVTRVVGAPVYAGTRVIQGAAAQPAPVIYTGAAGTAPAAAASILSGSLSAAPIVSGAVSGAPVTYTSPPVAVPVATYTADPVMVGTVTVDGGVYNPQAYGMAGMGGMVAGLPAGFQPHNYPVPMGTGLSPLGPGLRPSPPQRYTENMPDPASIEHQKQVYSRSLDTQLEQGEQMLLHQMEVQKQALRQAAEQQKQQFDMQVDQELKVQEMSVDQQANYQLMGLQQAHHEQYALLEQQANHAVLEFEQKKVQDEFARQQYEYQIKAHEKQQEMHREMEKQRQAFAARQRALQETYAMQGMQLQREAHAAALQAGGTGGMGGYGAHAMPGLLAGGALSGTHGAGVGWS